MDIVLTKHLRDKAQQRQIGLDMVEETVRKPDFTLPDPTDAELKWHIKKYNGRCLVVIIKEEVGSLKGVTVFYDRRLQRRGLCT